MERHCYRQGFSSGIFEPENNINDPIIEFEAGRSPNVVYSILEANIPTFDTVTKTCRLCLRGKFNSACSPQLGTLNSRNEIFRLCRHILGCLIEQAPDLNPKGPASVFPMNRYLIVMYNFWSLYVCLTIGTHVSVSMKLRVTEKNRNLILI